VQKQRGGAPEEQEEEKWVTLVPLLSLRERVKGGYGADAVKEVTLLYERAKRKKTARTSSGNCTRGEEENTMEKILFSRRSLKVEKRLPNVWTRARGEDFKSQDRIRGGGRGGGARKNNIFR